MSKMLWIIIFDDDKISCGQTKKILEQYSSENNVDMCIETVDNEDALFQYLDGHKNVSAAFLDIHTGTERNGIELAAEINRLAPEVSIVFLTAYLEYAINVYEVRHTYFVLKEEFRQRLPAVIEKLHKEQEQKNSEKVFFQLRNSGILLRSQDILYIERIGHSTVIQCKEERYRVSERLENIENRLTSRSFVRCHNSYIVNFMAVKQFFRRFFILEDDTQIPISRYKLQNVRERFLEWLK